MTAVGIKVTGVAELKKWFEKAAVTVDVSAREIVSLAAVRVINDAQANFEGSHRKGLPHQGGDRPNIVTGTLRRSIKGDGIRRDVIGTYSTTVGPTTKYGRRVELGLAPTGSYPYFGPAVSKNRKLITGIATGKWAAALRT